MVKRLAILFTALVVSGIAGKSVAAKAVTSARDDISPAEAKIFIAELKKFPCYPDCGVSGVDVDAGTVAVKASDTKLRETIIANLEQDSDSAYGRFKRLCEIKKPPAILIDIATVKLFNAGPLSPPFDGLFQMMARTCGTSNPDPDAFARSMTAVHFILVPAHEKGPRQETNYDLQREGLEYTFDKASGVLTIGLWPQRTNVEEEWYTKFVKKQ